MRQSIKSRLRRYTPDSVYFYYRTVRAPGQFASEFEVLGPLLRKDQNVVDAGAHIGLFSRFFARGSAQVFSFEPDPVVFEMLRRFAPKNVVPLNLGLSDHARSAVLATPVQHGLPCRGTGSVDTLLGQDDLAVNIQLGCLDDQQLSNIRLIKIDVEGHELSVLRGGAALLKQQRPYLWVEIEQRFYKDRAMHEVIREVESYGYRGYFYHPAKCRKDVSQFVPEEHQAGNAIYVNNFLFEPS